MANKKLVEAAKEAITGQLTGKKWYVSKTFWANIMAGTVVVVQVRYGFIVSAEYQLLGLSFINMGLRAITKNPVVW